MTDISEWSPEAQERLLALIAINDPIWFRPALWLLGHVPGTINIRRRLDNWQTARAVRLYRGLR